MSTSVPPDSSPPEFFIDRSLAREDVAEALRSADCLVRTHLEVYGERDEEVPDEEWLELAGREGWVVLTMDKRIRWRRGELAAIRRYDVKAFALTRGNFTAGEQAERFIVNLARIEEACAEPGPFVYVVHAEAIVRIYPA